MPRFYYGGQAVMEGVMMRGRQSVAAAIRQPGGDIYMYEEALNAKVYQSKLFRLPFLRGILMLWEMLVLGTRIMTLSTNIAFGTMIADARESLTAETTAASEEQAPQLGETAIMITLVISLLFAVALFFVTPLLLANLFRHQIGEGFLNLVIEGVIRLVLLVSYLYLIGRIPDIKRVFGYHGAEHKAINAMEQGDPLDVPHVRRASRVHTRCGTGFLLVVMVVSIFVFALISTPSLPIKIVSRILLVPVLAGISYELIRLGAAYYRFRVVRWLLAPSLALQGLTTVEPDDSMIECAIAALQGVVAFDQANVLFDESKQEDQQRMDTDADDVSSLTTSK
jgi:uncharacterized protein YqhQ